ncbi:hypothetical protein GCM10009429_08210 [Dyella marensis]
MHGENAWARYGPVCFLKFGAKIPNEVAGESSPDQAMRRYVPLITASHCTPPSNELSSASV